MDRGFAMQQKSQIAIISPADPQSLCGVQQEQSPWEKLNFYEQSVQKYLQANGVQLARLLEVDYVALHQEPSLSHHISEELELAAFQHDIRTKLADKCQTLRSSVESLAVDVAEILHLRSRNSQDMQLTVFSELEQTALRTKTKFDEMKNYFGEVFDSHRDNTATHLAHKQSANMAKLLYGVGAVCFSIPGAWSLWDLVKCTREKSESALETWLRSMAARFVGAGQGAPIAPVVCYPLVPFTLFGAGVACLYRCVDASKAEGVHASYMRQTVADIRFLRENRNQWEGMEQLVNELLNKVAKYKDLDQSREDRVMITLREISERLFNMRMSIDVYMVWLAKHNMFPANVSVPVLIGYESFTAINTMLTPDPPRSMTRLLSEMLVQRKDSSTSQVTGATWTALLICGVGGCCLLCIRSWPRLGWTAAARTVCPDLHSFNLS